MLVVQEQKFPATIGITLIEPSSKLSFSCTYEPSAEITSAASFSLIDTGTLETFFSAVYDSTYKPTDSVYKQMDDKVVTMTDKDFNQYKDSIPAQVLKYQQIDRNLSLQIVKHRGMLCIQFADP